ncbi:Dolichyl-phosphate-mannose-protein mannosyltransferase [Enhydrobacter aerosaccus]|uniref:Dolichyl-phosphate-mannose-protein mannosyltransferase n=1 Tax=Enhydrobacter aerosaccus TaxID=225324 RepID=A0A1T4MPS6_9HYPH|nr:glycosyltransferase family 39 protein [Enhydrobacter aerosaccus]SJZ69130.1 Dolichyl-phosphate-mannose-protein mannosyltransferase [Enhydrobacter aerosaccus]
MHRLALRDKADLGVAVAAFAAATMIGLGAAFVGMTKGGLWQDELYTSWIVDPAGGLAGMVSRALHDIGPPLYYLLLWPVVQLLGNDEVGLRLFSALCASAAVLLMMVAGRSFFSLPARLFAATLATASSFWFGQAQNARFYALGLLVSTGMLLLALATMRRERMSAMTVALFAVMAFGAFVHFYLFYEALAVLVVIVLYKPGQRMASIAFASALTLAVGLYVSLVIFRMSYASTGSNWIGNDWDWYTQQFAAILQLSLTHKAMLALALCLLPAVLAMIRRSRMPRRVPLGTWMSDRSDLVLCAAVPALVLTAGILTSFVATPNFVARYLLICSPFLWGLYAAGYDRSVQGAPVVVRWPVNLALSATALWMALTMAANRMTPVSEPFRESAAVIKTIPSCRGEVIPVVLTEQRRWFRSPDAEIPMRAAYAKYLQGFADPQPLYLEDILSDNVPEDWKLLFRQRIDGQGCPVLAWLVHRVTRDMAEEIGQRILAVTGRSSKAQDLAIIVAQSGMDGYIVTLKR